MTGHLPGGPATPTPAPSSTPAPTPTPQTVKIQSVEGTLSRNAVNIGGLFELQNFRVVNVEELNKLGGVSASVLAVSKSGTVFGPEIIERSAVRADLLPGDAQGFVYAHVQLQNELVDVSSVTLPPNL